MCSSANRKARAAEGFRLQVKAFQQGLMEDIQA
jgi:hypothetical protein